MPMHHSVIFASLPSTSSIFLNSLFIFSLIPPTTESPSPSPSLLLYSTYTSHSHFSCRNLHFPSFTHVHLGVSPSSFTHCKWCKGDQNFYILGLEVTGNVRKRREGIWSLFFTHIHGFCFFSSVSYHISAFFSVVDHVHVWGGSTSCSLLDFWSIGLS